MGSIVAGGDGEVTSTSVDLEPTNYSFQEKANSNADAPPIVDNVFFL